MKKIVKLTENDLSRIVRRVIKEQEEENLDNNNFFEFTNTMVGMENASKSQISKALKKLPKSVRFLSILNGEFADFSDVDLCSLPTLFYVNLRGTPNNFEETQGDCYVQMSDNMYDFTDEKGDKI